MSDGFVARQAFVPLVYLVGMKKDLRAADFMEEQQQQLEEEEGRLGRPRTTASLAAYPTCSVGPSEVSQVLFHNHSVAKAKDGG